MNTTNNEVIKRRSGIELLRIIAAIMVVFSHIVPVLTKTEIVSIEGGGNLLIINVLRSISVCAVDIFIIISGYFLWRNNKRPLGKVINLILLMSIINVSSYLMQIVLGKVCFDLYTLLRYLFSPNYFVTLYVVLFIISPYINVFLQQLNDKGWIYFIVIIFALFSVYAIVADVLNEVLQINLKGISPIGRDGSQHGYNIVNFILLYCIGAFINAQQIKIQEIKTGYVVLIMILCVCVVYIWSVVGVYFPNYSNSAHGYHNPFVLIMALSMFVLFGRMSFYSGFVNSIAKAAFTTFLLHQHFFPFLPINTIVRLSPVFFLGSLLLLFISIYLISWILWKIYDLIFGRALSLLDKVQMPYGLK